MILCHYDEVTLKPELSMDGIMTIVAGLVLVVVINIAAANQLERRHSSVALLTSDVQDVAKTARDVHAFVTDEFPPSAGAITVSAKQHEKLQRLLQEYSNPLFIVDHTLAICGLKLKNELDTKAIGLAMSIS